MGVKNLLYWNLHQSTPGSSPHVVKFFWPSPQYKLTAPPQDLFSYPLTGFTYGIAIRGAGINPLTSELHFYTLVPDTITVPGVDDFPVDYYRLHTWDPNRNGLPVAGSDATTSSAFINLQNNVPRFFVVETGRWYFHL